MSQPSRATYVLSPRKYANSMEVHFKPSFVRLYNKLPPALQEEVREKIDLLKDISNHQKLRVHKLQGAMKDTYSFSINYHYRIVFMFENKKKSSAVLLVIGTHEIYQ
jgi:plasmid maintenance system killer protein